LASLRLPESVRQHLFATGTQTAAALAAAVAQSLKEGLRQRGRASLVVSGGRTPVPFLDQLSSHQLDWSGVTVNLADDRCVPANHADSNEGLVRRHLLQGAAATARLLPLVDLGATPETQLVTAEHALATAPRPFDVVVLGMGEDGHTASLFPGAPETAAALDTRRPQRLAAVTPPKAPHRRISLTLRALLDTRLLAIQIEGESKRTAIELAARSAPAQHPIAAVLRQDLVPVQLFYNP
jgi:6-phosphogluconolactonase